MKGKRPEAGARAREQEAAQRARPPDPRRAKFQNLKKYPDQEKTRRQGRNYLQGHGLK